jgi:hypothetical protein
MNSIRKKRLVVDRPPRGCRDESSPVESLFVAAVGLSLVRE